MDRAAEFKSLVAKYAKISAEEISDDMSFRDDLGLSSLDFMTFLGEVEDTFDVELDLDRAVKISTIGEAIEMMNELAAA